MVSDTIITLPPGYTVEDKPEDLHQTMLAGRYDRTCEVNGDTLTIHETATELPATVPPADYPKLRAQFEAVEAASKQPIVLRRTGS